MNLFGIGPFKQQFYDTAIGSLQYVLSNCQTVENIEIELKYAQFMYFNEAHPELVRQFPPADREKVKYGYDVSSSNYMTGLLALSRQSVVNLNPLGRNIYGIRSGFNEHRHRKFYHMREFMVKMCHYNQRPSHRPSIYKDFSDIADNRLFEMVDENELRLDVFIKDEAPQELRGRYSYSQRTGWRKTRKEPLQPQIDYMLDERAFRFAINREHEVAVEAQKIAKIASLLKNKPKITDIRLKRSLKAAKREVCQFSLSEIYNIRENQGFKQLPDLLMADQQTLQIYLQTLFINFYTQSERDKIQFEIECEFSPVLVQKMKAWLGYRQPQRAKHYIQAAVQDLYALFYADHSTKVREIGWLRELCPDVLPDTRLENEFGGYMRGELYDRMVPKQ